MGTHKWTKDKIAAKAKLYNSRSDFKLNGDGAYNAAQRQGILHIVCNHMVHGKVKWTKKTLKQEALLYNTRSDFATESGSAYITAIKQNLLDTICTHMRQPPAIRTKEELFRTAAHYSTPQSLRKAHPNTYNAIMTRKLRFEAFKHMGGKYTEWTDSALIAEGLKYKSKTAFKVANPYAYRLAGKFELLDKIFTNNTTQDSYKIPVDIKGVYILKHNDKYVYIGKSLTCINKRVQAHTHSKIFNTVEVLEFKTDSDIHIAEIYLIMKHSTEYNTEFVEEESPLLCITELDIALKYTTQYTSNTGQMETYA